MILDLSGDRMFSRSWMLHAATRMKSQGTSSLEVSEMGDLVYEQDSLVGLVDGSGDDPLVRGGT